jgi:hypothetical protein
MQFKGQLLSVTFHLELTLSGKFSWTRHDARYAGSIHKRNLSIAFLAAAVSNRLLEWCTYSMVLFLLMSVD